MAAVAISMALTPFVMLIYEKLPMHKSSSPEEQRSTESIEERNQVIIAGFGHFGNTVGRFLRANGISATYLDIDSSRVDLLRKMGFKVYYGDASRYDLLSSAGADEAKILIIAIDHEEKRLEMIETVKKHFPHLEIFARAANRYDAYEQLHVGIKNIYRESIDTSLRLGADVLKRLGRRAYAAQRAAHFFLKYDEETVVKLSKLETKHDSDDYINEANKYTAELEAILAEDQKTKNAVVDSGWDSQSLRQEFGEKP
jgi:monovalent cation:H+ antiporter-2, CPA2 family